MGATEFIRSLDGGKTWDLMGLENTTPYSPGDHRSYQTLISCTLGAIGSPWGEHPERGVFKTTDGGKTWNKILYYANNRSGVGDMVMDPANPNKLMVAMWEHKRDPWFFQLGR